MKRVFVDTSRFFALLCPEDQSHECARPLFVQANTEQWRLVTTNAVVIETHALLLARLHDGRRHALGFLDRLVRSHGDKDYSLCDALSFVVMERMRLKEAIAFDRHFREYGRFVLL